MSAAKTAAVAIMTKPAAAVLAGLGLESDAEVRPQH